MHNKSYKDDPSICNEDVLLRRVPVLHNQIVWDGNLNQWRPSSAVFTDHPDGSPMSISLLSVLNSRALPAKKALEGYEATHVLAGLTAAVARQNGQAIAREPLANNSAHGVVFGQKTRQVRRKLALAATWVIPPSWDPPDSAT